jgi:hypothetical protein
MLKPKPIFYVILASVLIWTNIWFNGLFSTVMWLIIISAMVGIFLKVTDRI